MSSIFGMKEIHLPAGKMPIIGLGCFFGRPDILSADNVQKWIEQAIELGYRHLDTAYLYQTEAPVGRAVRNKIRDGLIRREDIFVTSKLSYVHHQPEQVKWCVEESVKTLDLGYIDLYLVHWPCGGDTPENIDIFSNERLINSDKNDYIAVWKILEDYVKGGVIKSIGVSNFNARQLQNVLDNCIVKPVLNQCEVNVYYQNKRLRRYCEERGVHMTAYTPLGSGQPSVPRNGDWKSPLEDSLITEFSQKYKKTPAQLVLRYLVQQNVSVIPSSTDQARQAENIHLFDFEIEPGDMEKIDLLDRNKKCVTMDHLAYHKDYPFHDPF